VSRADMHAWVRARLVAWASGLLDPEATARIDEHLAGCDACRTDAAVLSATRPGDDALGEHIPAAALARWDRWSVELRGLSRALVRQHLERCDVCRSQLETLGYRAELPVVTALEAAGRDDRAPTVQPRPPLARRLAWVLGAAVALAACVAIVVRLVPPAPRPGEGPVVVQPGPTPPDTTSPPAPGPGETREELLALGPATDDAVAIESVVRGEADSAVTTLRLGDRGAVAVQVPFEIAVLEGNPPVTVELIDQDGRAVRRLDTRLAELAPRDTRRDLRLRAGAPALAPGDYRLVFTVGPPGTRREYRVRIE